MSPETTTSSAFQSAKEQRILSTIMFSGVFNFVISILPGIRSYQYDPDADYEANVREDLMDKDRGHNASFEEIARQPISIVSQYCSEIFY